PDGKLVAALAETTKGSMKGVETKYQAIIWDVSTGKKTQSIKVDSRTARLGSVANVEGSISFTSDGAALAVRNLDSIKIWDLNTGRELKSMAAPALSANRTDGMEMFASKFAFSPDRRLIAMLGDGTKITIVDANSGAVVR